MIELVLEKKLLIPKKNKSGKFSPCLIFICLINEERINEIKRSENCTQKKVKKKKRNKLITKSNLTYLLHQSCG
jgi:hypothetical protein